MRHARPSIDSLYTTRFPQNKKRSKALKVFLEDRRAVEPWEIDELRMANADALPDRAAFQELLRALQEAFPQGTAPYREFIQVRACVRGWVGGVVVFQRTAPSPAIFLNPNTNQTTRKPPPQVVSRTLAARGQRLQLTHYLDRAILFLNPDGGDVDLLTLLCALSLTLNVPLEERIAALHDVAAALGGGGRGGDGDGEGEAVEGRAGSVVDLTALQRLVAGLVATAQVPAEALVVADKGKAAYPFQSYRVATVEELAERAVKELAEAAAKAKPPEPPLEIGPQGLSPEELTRVLATKAICAWGECYRGR